MITLIIPGMKYYAIALKRLFACKKNVDHFDQEREAVVGDLRLFANRGLQRGIFHRKAGRSVLGVSPSLHAITSACNCKA
jgi:hypothetical protein